MVRKAADAFSLGLRHGEWSREVISASFQAHPLPVQRFSRFRGPFFAFSSLVRALFLFALIF